MKKVGALLATVSYLASAASAYAITLQPPTGIGIAPDTNPGIIISNAMTIIYIVAAILVLFFLILGAFQWITSGGDKEKIGKARGAIINALIGLAILALAWVIISVVGAVLKINILQPQGFPIPDLQGGDTGI